MEGDDDNDARTPETRGGERVTTQAPPSEATMLHKSVSLFKAKVFDYDTLKKFYIAACQDDRKKCTAGRLLEELGAELDSQQLAELMLLCM